jgi:hypothetical protein
VRFVTQGLGAVSWCQFWCQSVASFVAIARNVKRWRVGDHALRWTATGLLEAEKKFHKVKGYRELEILQRKLNPSLTQQEQVA